MKRDMELIRKILLFVESIDSTSRYQTLAFEGCTDDAIDHHVRLLIDKGYLRENGGVAFTMTDVAVTGGAMTSEGHDFLDAARDSGIWRKAMDRVASTTGGVTIEVFKALLIDLGRKALGLSS